MNDHGSFTRLQLIAITQDLINPSMIDSVNRIWISPHTPYIVFYTSKSKIVDNFDFSHVQPEYIDRLVKAQFFDDEKRGNFSHDVMCFSHGSLEKGWD